jgi:deoxyribodipyrimidine photolyase-related protein
VASMTTLHLILGDQLNSQHSHFKQADPQTVFVMMEVRQETDYVLHHAQKILAIFAAMRDFAQTLKLNGHRVHYFKIDDANNSHSITTNLDHLIGTYDANRIIYQAPDEYRLDQQLAQYASTHRLPVEMIDTEHFITQRDETEQIFKGRKQWLME